MNRPETELDQQLADLLRDAVADVEPHDRFADVRAGIPDRRSTRRWAAVGGGSVLAVAATVTAIALAGNPAPTATDPNIADDPTETPSDLTSAVAAYFVGDTPVGPRLYREFQPYTGDPSPHLAGLDTLESGPLDPDYESLWPAGSFADFELGAGGTVLDLYLSDAAPTELTELAQQQVVFTVSGALQKQVQVVFHREGDVIATAAMTPRLDTMSHVNISDPFEGQVTGSVLHVKGVASSYEATVPWRLLQGSVEVDGGFFTATGWMGAKLFPFSGEIDVSSLDPGSYTLIVETSDASGGAEGPGAYSDSRSFVIE